MTTFHCCLSVRGALRWPKRRLRGLCMDENGDRLAPDEVREWLLDELSKGHEVLPLGDACDGFDFKTGCPGHLSVATADKPTGDQSPPTDATP